MTFYNCLAVERTRPACSSCTRSRAKTFLLARSVAKAAEGGKWPLGALCVPVTLMSGSSFKPSCHGHLSGIWERDVLLHFGCSKRSIGWFLCVLMRLLLCWRKGNCHPYKVFLKALGKKWGKLIPPLWELSFALKRTGTKPRRWLC